MSFIQSSLSISVFQDRSSFSAQSFMQQVGPKLVQNQMQSPYNSIGKLTCQFQDKSKGVKHFIKQGIATIVSLYTLVTSLHNVYDEQHNIFSKQITFQPIFLKYQNNQSNKKRFIKVSHKFHYNQQYFSKLSKRPHHFDIAFLKMKYQGKLIDQSQILRINVDYDIKSTLKDIIQIVGYPSASEYKKNHLHFERRPSICVNGHQIHYSHMTQSGYSGSPVLIIQKDGKYSLIAIHEGHQDIKQKKYSVGILMRSLKGNEHILSQIIQRQGGQQKFKDMYVPTFKRFKTFYLQNMKKLNEKNRINQQKQKQKSINVEALLFQVQYLSKQVMSISPLKLQAESKNQKLTKQVQYLKLQLNQALQRIKQYQKVNKMMIQMHGGIQLKQFPSKQ